MDEQATNSQLGSSALVNESIGDDALFEIHEDQNPESAISRHK